MHEKQQEEWIFKKGIPNYIENPKIDFWGDSPVFELGKWNFCQMLVLGFPETSQNMSSFKQLLFSSFHKGDQKNLKKK